MGERRVAGGDAADVVCEAGGALGDAVVRALCVDGGGVDEEGACEGGGRRVELGGEEVEVLDVPLEAVDED